MTTAGRPSHLWRDRAESFGAVAGAYDRYRPSYPDALIDDLVAPGPRDGLDVGCGTGKAAGLLAGRGLDVLGVEIDPAMAAVARGHGIPVEVGAFETWDARGRTFDLITCGQAWHWMDPERAVPKAATLLRPGGALALFWNHDELGPDTRAAVEAVYTRLEPDRLGTVVVAGARADRGDYAGRLRTSGWFTAVEERRYTWDWTRPAADWLAMVATHSDHLTLPAPRRERLLAELATALAGREVVSHYGTYLVLARTPG